MKARLFRLSQYRAVGGAVVGLAIVSVSAQGWLGLEPSEMAWDAALLGVAGGAAWLLADFSWSRARHRNAATGLPNGRMLEKHRCIPESALVAVVTVDGIHAIRLEHGAEEEAKAARFFARRLKGLLAPGDELFHISDGEFVVLCVHPHQHLTAGCLDVAEQALRLDWRVGDDFFPLAPCIGIDPPDRSRNPAELSSGQSRYRNASQALVSAAAAGMPCGIYQASFSSLAREDRALLHGLLSCLSGRPSDLSLSIVAQPIVSAASTHRIVGAEILLRAQHRELGPIPPDRIVRLCEVNGLGGCLGEWLFRSSARPVHGLFHNSGFAGYVSININPSILCGRLPLLVDQFLLDAGIPASSVCLEITEDNLVARFDKTNAQLLDLRSKGVLIAIDDFGTGYSSLQYLKNLSVDIVKIDRSFIKDIEAGGVEWLFLESLCKTINVLGFRVVLEGIERSDQWDACQSLNIDYLQGFFSFRPVDFPGLYRLLEAQGT